MSLLPVGPPVVAFLMGVVICGCTPVAVTGPVQSQPRSSEVSSPEAAGVGEASDDDQRSRRKRAARRARRRNQRLVSALAAGGLAAHSSERGVVITLPDLLFGFGSAELTAPARHRVAEIAAVVLGKARGRKVEVAGHSDAIGPELYNLGLSRRRAASVAGLLVEHGVSPALLSVRGYGSKYPMAPNLRPDGSDDQSGRARNRRVEVTIAD